jgi:long-chain acyl-CoA synthetase
MSSDSAAPVASFFQGFSQTRAGLTAPGAPFELVELTDAEGQRLKAFKNAFAHLPALLNAGRAHGGKEFIVHEGDRWSFDRLFTAADALAGHLQHTLGVQPGDRVAIAMRNRPEWVVAFVAASLAGAVPVPLNSYGLHEELSAALRLTTPRVLVADTQRLLRLGSALPALVSAVVEVQERDHGAATMPDRTGLRPDVQTYEMAVLSAPGGPAAHPPAPAPQDPALILFTSGATSEAKGVLSSHRAVCQALFNIDFIGAVSAMTSPEAIAGFMQRGFAPTTLTAVPLFHVSGLHAQLLSSLRHGRRLVFMRRWDPAHALELIRDEHITQFNGAPSMVMQLLEQPGFDRSGAARSLGGLGFGGAGLPQRLMAGVGRHMAQTMTGIGFGLTETNGVGAASSGQLFARVPRAAGAVSPLMDCRIVGQEGASMPVGQPGEIWLRGASLMDGYWQQPEATAQAFSGGWFRTGDIGFLDEHGLLQVVDRIKDVINRNGEKIAAAEVESCLLMHPQVLEAAVYAVPDELTGEAVVAEVVLRPGELPNAAALRGHAAEHLAAYKVPQHVVMRQDPLPRNPAGKALKPALREAFLKSFAAAKA